MLPIEYGQITIDDICRQWHSQQIQQDIHIMAAFGQARGPLVCSLFEYADIAESKMVNTIFSLC